MTDPIRQVVVTLREDVLPPRDPSHGTPHAMLRRQLEVETPAGAATWEQTDYGHPGRLNAWEPRKIDAKLQPRTNDLRAIAEAIAVLLTG